MSIKGVKLWRSEGKHSNWPTKTLVLRGGERKALESTHETLFCFASPAIFNNFTANGDIFHHIRARERNEAIQNAYYNSSSKLFIAPKKTRSKRSLQKALERLFMMISSGWKHLHIHFDGVLFALERDEEHFQISTSPAGRREEQKQWEHVTRSGEKYSRVVESASSEKKLLLTLAKPPRINSMTWKKTECVTHSSAQRTRKMFYSGQKKFESARLLACWDFLYFFNLFYHSCDGVTSGMSGGSVENCKLIHFTCLCCWLDRKKSIIFLQWLFNPSESVGLVRREEYEWRAESSPWWKNS